MQQEQHHQRPPPPAYAQHEPESFHLPSVPTHLPNAQHNNGRLPGIKSLDLPETTARHTPRNSIEHSPRNQFDGSQWGVLPSLNSATFPRVPDGLPREDIGSPMDTASVRSLQDDTVGRRETSVNIDDPDVRLAAEALSGLGNPDFVRSPTARSLTLSAREPTADPEPLLSLITSNHPWLGGAVNGSISAYNTTKGYTPRFVQYGAELIERNIGSPMVNTVSSVGRRTGMEENLRRYLGEVHRRPSDLEAGDGEASRSKRQRIASPADDAMDIDDAHAASRTRGGSQSSSQSLYAESLPAYDDQRSPNYEESLTAADSKSSRKAERSQTPQDRRVNWSTQLIMTTSGLGVALSDTSLRSLKLCLGLLRSATTHIDSVMRALKVVLEEYEAALRSRRQSDGQASVDENGMERMEGTMAQMGLVDAEKDDQVRRIADRIKSLSSDIWTTLQSVVQSVSRYTGGTLPANASQVVRTQLLSVPQRWQVAGRNAGQDNQGEEVRGANRMLAFAKEGLDMMGQITTVVDGTVQSAESWLARIGRRTPGSQTGEGQEQTANGRGTYREKTPLALENGHAINEKR
ncbi:clock-controlled protein 8 [Cucurbitaria berberidis CBS 394.84]|uniref:Clock-controlled protein 8 n=1 Tax=Cucurbitaria berberidis CBS 394.84 TaxID=1168544 RepID=A0A9P4GMM6_9PLEO|nr:clock-controlled protein 8 [Cucurbitaria berberidis CBS 394.84]KAF1847992.1 clock-controlled protein 8 [Cucurbitaria berberidis CBS 394.84]